MAMVRYLLLAICVLVLASCAKPTPYQPAVSGHGYAEQQLEDNRFRVSFAGNSLTARETVEDYLLYRAAELTLARGGDLFVVTDRETETTTTYRTYFDGFPGYGFYRYRYWDPWYRHHWHWDPWYPGPAYTTARPIRTYEAFADIVIYRGSKPPGDTQAFDAREIIQKIGPRVVRPEARAAG